MNCGYCGRPVPKFCEPLGFCHPFCHMSYEMKKYGFTNEDKTEELITRFDLLDVDYEKKS